MTVTVGELYTKTYMKAWDNVHQDTKGLSFVDEARRCMNAAIPGLWDAEVLEKRIESKGWGELIIDHFTPAEARRLALAEGQPLRIIVLRQRSSLP